MVSPVMYSSLSDEWETPQELFDYWDNVFHFTLDPCASEENHKCSLFYTKEDDGLSKDWRGHTVFVNPPYGREIGKWVEKCYLEAQKKNTKVVALLPARTDTRWFHDWIYHTALVYFLRGRLKFSKSKNSAPFPSMIVIWW